MKMPGPVDKHMVHSPLEDWAHFSSTVSHRRMGPGGLDCVLCACFPSFPLHRVCVRQVGKVTGVEALRDCTVLYGFLSPVTLCTRARTLSVSLSLMSMVMFSLLHSLQKFTLLPDPSSHSCCPYKNSPASSDYCGMLPLLDRNSLKWPKATRVIAKSVCGPRTYILSTQMRGRHNLCQQPLEKPA